MEDEKLNNNFSQSIDRLRTETRSQIVKWLIASSISLLIFAAAGWWFYFKPYIIYVVGGVPSGGIVAFDDRDDCPRGWDTFDDVVGRVIVGAGQATGLKERKAGDRGGLEVVPLTTNQLPSHRHKITEPYHFTGGPVDIAKGTSYGLKTEPKWTEPEGNGEPHENMPPYIALLYCKKK